MIESPLIHEYFGEELAAAAAQTKRNALQRFLASRFGAVAPEMASALQAIQDDGKLDKLIDWAGQCANLEEFSRRMPQWQ